MKFTLLKCAVQCLFSIFKDVQSPSQPNVRIFSSSPKEPIFLSSHTPSSWGPFIHFVVSMDLPILDFYINVTSFFHLACLQTPFGW